MKITIPHRVRIALYILNVLGTPLVVYARAKDWIGDLELALWGSEVAAVMALAGLNVNSSEPSPVVIEPQGDVYVSGEDGAP